MSFTIGQSFQLPVPKPPPALAVDDASGSVKNKTEIAIIGAGPSGLLAACLLKKIEKDVKVFDMRERPLSFWGSFPIVLNKRGLTALERLGPDLMAKVHRLGRYVDGMDILRGNNTVASIDFYGLCIMRDQVVGLLLEMADQLAVPIYWKHKFVGTDIDKKSAKFELDDGPYTKQKLTVQVQQALVGADGNYSRVRTECELERGLLTVQRWDWGILTRYLLATNPPSLPPNIDCRVQYVLGDDGYLLQQPDGMWLWALTITDKSDDFLLSEDASPQNIAKLKALCQEKGGIFTEHLLTDDDIYASFFRSRVFGGSLIRCSTLAPTDWIALIGDAAHATAPYLGEGTNAALESASILAATLACSGNTCLDYDEVRREDAHSVTELGLRRRKLVAGTGAQRCVKIFGTVVLDIAKKHGIISCINEDLMMGVMAKERDPVPYTELLAMDKRQRCCLDPLAMCCFYTVCCGCCGRCRLK